MATIPTSSGAAYLNTARRSYLATRSFEDDFFAYTTSVSASFQNVGTLTPVTGNAALCPQGRVLHETGRKLYPGANPGVTSYMVGVYDDQTGLRGFINPNCAVFLVLNSDKPNYLPQESETSGGTFGGLNQGQPVFTHGDVVAGGDMDISGNGAIHGDSVVHGDSYVYGNEQVNGDIVSGGIIVSQPVLVTTGNGTITIDLAEYSHAFITINGATTITVSNVAVGRTLDLIVLASGGNQSLAFNPGPIFAGNAFNRTLNNGTRLGMRMVCMNGTQIHPVSDCAY
jgi:hypothetical protein